jgi:hypothetical protein
MIETFESPVEPEVYGLRKTNQKESDDPLDRMDSYVHEENREISVEFPAQHENGYRKRGKGTDDPDNRFRSLYQVHGCRRSRILDTSAALNDCFSTSAQ